MRHILTLDDLSTPEIEQVLTLAEDLKRDFQQGIRTPRLAGRVLGLLFSKPSLRTRVSFEAGMTHLGGASLYLGQDVGWGTRESIADFARVVSQYLDAIVCRTHAHSTVEQLARYSSCPVINGLTDLAHPCQALADVMTLRELGSRQAPGQTGLHRRRQQRLAQSGHRLQPLGHPFQYRRTRRLPLGTGPARATAAARIRRREIAADDRPRRGRCRTPRPSIPMSGRAWVLKPNRSAASEILPRTR